MTNINDIIKRLDVSQLELCETSLKELNTSNTAENKAKLIHEYVGQNKPERILHNVLRMNGTMKQDSFEKYLSSELISSSVLKSAYKSDYHLKYLLEKGSNETKYLQLGTLIHSCILEPSKFNKLVVLPPDVKMNSLSGVEAGINYLLDTISSFEDHENIIFMASIHSQGYNRDTLKGKKKYYELLLKYSEIQTIDNANFEAIEQIKRNLNDYGNGILNKLLKWSKREISFYTDKFKVRPDAILLNENIGIDAILSVKTTSKSSLTEFFSQCAKLHYDLSEAMYQEIVSECTERNFDTTLMLMVQTVPPYQIALFIWDEKDISNGSRKYQIAKLNYDKCLSEGYRGHDKFSDYSGLLTFQLPGWNKV